MADDDLIRHRRFVAEIQQAIRLANREVLHPVMDPLTEERIIAVAVEVAKRRAAYMKATLDLGAGGDKPTGDALGALRSAYEESRDAFGELMTTIERGYVDIPGD